MELYRRPVGATFANAVRATRFFSAAVLLGILILIGCQDGFLYPLLILMAAIVHESGHLLAALLCAVPLKDFSMHPAGLSLTYDADGVSYPKEMAVILAGPLSGIAAAAAVWECLGLNSEGAFFFFFTSLAMSFFNLLPLPPLDGSALLSAFFSWAGRADIAPDILRVTGVLGAVFVFAVSLSVQFFLGGNLSLFAVSVWLLYSLQKVF